MTPSANMCVDVLCLDIMPAGLKLDIYRILRFHVLSLNIQMRRHVTLGFVSPLPALADSKRLDVAVQLTTPKQVCMSASNANVRRIFLPHQDDDDDDDDTYGVRLLKGAERECTQTSGTSKQEDGHSPPPFIVQTNWKQSVI